MWLFKLHCNERKVTLWLIKQTVCLIRNGCANIIGKVDELKNSGNYSTIYVNKGIRNEVKDAAINRRPDIMAVRRDGKIDQFEIKSKTDKAEELYRRLNENRLMMGNRAGTIEVLNTTGR